MKFDDYRPLLNPNNKISGEIIDLFKLDRKIDINIVWAEHNHKCDPELQKIIEEHEKQYKK